MRNPVEPCSWDRNRPWKWQDRPFLARKYIFFLLFNLARSACPSHSAVSSFVIWAQPSFHSSVYSTVESSHTPPCLLCPIFNKSIPSFYLLAVVYLGMKWKYGVISSPRGRPSGKSWVGISIEINNRKMGRRAEWEGISTPRKHSKSPLFRLTPDLFYHLENPSRRGAMSSVSVNGREEKWEAFSFESSPPPIYSGEGPRKICFTPAKIWIKKLGALTLKSVFFFVCFFEKHSLGETSVRHFARFELGCCSWK